MAESIAFVTDARLAKVIEVLDAAGECLNLNPDDDSLDTYRFSTPGGAYVTAFWDLKPDIDEYETVVDVYEQTDAGAAARLFEVVASSIEQKIVLFGPDSDEVIAESNGR